LQRELDIYVRNNPGFPPSTNNRPRAVLLITERGFDIMSPLLHEFTYQAMAYDLVDTNDGQTFFYEFTTPNGGKEKKEARFEEKDNMFMQLRHMHMKDTLEKLMGDFNKFCQDNILFSDQTRAASLNDMRDMLAGLPEFTETRSQFALHINVAEKSMEIFNKKELKELGLVEQV
jgi:syntaxin-binding protein 1